MYLITNLRISSLELLEVVDWEPYNKKLNFSLTFKFKKLESTISRLQRVLISVKDKDGNARESVQ